MAANFNKVILIGNLTRDVELRHTASNLAIAKIGLACNRRWRTPEGEQREETMFIDCEAFGKTAEFVSQYFSKGKSILIEGRLKLDQWEDKETKAKRSKHVVSIENVQFVESKGGGGGGGGDEGGGGNYRSGNTSRPAPAAAPAGGGGASMQEDDIPF
jgi:single-strand DNA-binding protein